MPEKIEAIEKAIAKYIERKTTAYSRCAKAWTMEAANMWKGIGDAYNEMINDMSYIKHLVEEKEKHNG